MRAGHIPKRGHPGGCPPLCDGYVYTCFTTYVVLWFATILLTQANEEGMGTWGRWTRPRSTRSRVSVSAGAVCSSARMPLSAPESTDTAMARWSSSAWESPASSSRPSRSTSRVCSETAASKRSSTAAAPSASVAGPNGRTGDGDTVGHPRGCPSACGSYR